jgi:hypothetical protein
MCEMCGKPKVMKTRISESGPPADPEGDRLTANVVRYFGVDKRYAGDTDAIIRAGSGGLSSLVDRRDVVVSTKQAPPWRRKGI